MFSLKSNFSSYDEFKGSISKIIDILYENGYVTWSAHLKSADTNATHFYHTANQVLCVVQYMLKQDFVKYLDIKNDLEKIVKYCITSLKDYSRSFLYLFDMADPIAKQLYMNGYVGLSEQIRNALNTSQSAYECTGETLFALQEALSHKCAKELGIEQNLKQAIIVAKKILRQ